MPIKNGNAPPDASNSATDKPSVPKRIDRDTEPRLPMPHDRDESAGEQAHPPDASIEQAGKDVARGLRDTDLRGTVADSFDAKFGPRKEHGTP